MNERNDNDDAPTAKAYSQTRPFEAPPGTEYPAVPGYGPPSGPPPPGTGFDDPSQPAADPPRPAKPRRRVGMIVTISALVLVLVLVVAGVGSELYLRNATKDCLQKSFAELTGSSASVSLSKKPMLLQAATGEVPYVQIDTSGDDGSAISLHGRADNIKGISDGSTIGRLAATGSVPFSRIVELSKQTSQQSTDTTQNQQPSTGLGGLFGDFTLDGLTGDPSTGTITVNAGVSVAGLISIPVSTEIKPVTTGGKIDFQVVKASALVFGIPSNFAQTLVDGVSKSLFPPLFDQLSIDKLSVTSTGVDFAVTGTDVPLDQNTSGSTSGSQGQTTCTVI